MKQYQNHIGGHDVAAADGRTFTGFNPTTGGVWGTFALAGAQEVDRAVQAASTPFAPDRGASCRRRAKGGS